MATTFHQEKILEEKFYKLMEGVDVEKIEKECEGFRKKIQTQRFWLIQKMKIIDKEYESSIIKSIFYKEGEDDKW